MPKPMEAVWEKVKSAIKSQIPTHSYEMWIEPLDLKRGENDHWILACPNFFSKKRVSDLYGNLISAVYAT
jgi:chromosomal replication initiator protein